MGSQKRRGKIIVPLPPDVEIGPCLLCGEAVGHPEKTPCPFRAVEQFRDGGPKCWKCGQIGGQGAFRVPGSVGGVDGCAECKNRFEVIEHWEYEVKVLLRRRDRMLKKLALKQGKTPLVTFPGPLYILRNLPCGACRAKKSWEPGVTRGDAPGWVCPLIVRCSRCHGHGLTGRTKTERLAQRLGDFGVCPRCSGKKRLPCTGMIPGPGVFR